MPLPLPPTSSGDGPALLWSFSVPLFYEPPAVCSGGSIFPSLSHSLKKSPSDRSQGLRAGPYPKQCRRLLSVRPLLLVAGAGVWGYFSAGSCFQARNLWALFNFSSQLGGKTSPRPASARVSCWLETSSIETPFPVRFPSLVLLCPFLIFNIFVLPPFEDNGLLSWAPDVRC